jgi:hypothetical protein
LQGDFEAFLDDFALHWLVEIEALTNAAGCLEYFIGGKV